MCPELPKLHNPFLSSPLSSTKARIQFRLPDGRGKTKIFDSDCSLSELYAHVHAEMEVPFTNFSLSTTFPTKLLDDLDPASPLKEHGLAPSATVLVLPKSDGRQGRERK